MKSIFVTMVLFAFTCSILLVSVVNAKEYNDRNNNVSEIEKNEWQVKSFVQNPDSEIIKVELKEKYGIVQEFYCTSIFENTKTLQLKFNSKKETVVIYIGNMVYCKISKIKK